MTSFDPWMWSEAVRVTSWKSPEKLVSSFPLVPLVIVGRGPCDEMAELPCGSILDSQGGKYSEYWVKKYFHVMRRWNFRLHCYHGVTWPFWLTEGIYEVLFCNWILVSSFTLVLAMTEILSSKCWVRQVITSN